MLFARIIVALFMLLVGYLLLCALWLLVGGAVHEALSVLIGVVVLAWLVTDDVKPITIAIRKPDNDRSSD